MPGIPATMDPRNVTIIIDGRVITGYAADGVFTLTQNADLTTPVTGVQGDTVYQENADESWTLTITLMPTSASVPYLDGIARARRKFATAISDASEDSRMSGSGSGCRITKLPDRNRGGSVGTMSYSIYVPKLKLA